MLFPGDLLTTSVDIRSYFPKITYRESISMIGSCFAEHIDRKLARYKYKVSSNPFGILYNPAPIAKSFQRIVEEELYTVDDLVMYDGLYHSMDHHGSFSGPDPEVVINRINDLIFKFKSHLSNSLFVFVSLGTSKVYRYKGTGHVAGNNHKLPHTHFEPHTMTVEECIIDFEKIYRTIKSITPTTHVIWTVSPIRHLRDGLIENQRSKAALILAIDEFTKKFNDTSYFPAYEIMMDQLRDYRFYARDLVHPSELAIDIIWDLFTRTYLDPQETLHHLAIEKIKRAAEHRFLHDNKPAIKSFAESQLRNIDYLANLLPEMDWKEERQYFFHLIEPD